MTLRTAAYIGVFLLLSSPTIGCGGRGVASGSSTGNGAKDGSVGPDGAGGGGGSGGSGGSGVTDGPPPPVTIPDGAISLGEPVAPEAWSGTPVTTGAE